MPAPLRVFHQLHLAHSALFRALDRSMKEREGIVTAHQVILFVLALEDGLPTAEVARRTGHPNSRLTGLLDALVKKKLLERRASEGDGRVQLLHITKAGRTLIERNKAMTQSLNADLLKPFSVDEQGVIARFLQHVEDSAIALDKPKTKSVKKRA